MKILIIRLSSIGDIVLTSPVIRCVKEQVQNAEVHFCTKEQFKSVVEHNPFIDKIHYLKNSIKDLNDELKLESFDIILDLHKNLRTLRIKKMLKTKSYSFDKVNLAKYLMVQFKINKLPDIHIVDRYMATASQLGVENDNKGLDYFIEENSKINIEAKFNIIPNQYIALVIGAQHSTKRLPNDKLLEIIDKLESPVILLGGGKTDEDNARYLVQNAQNSTLINGVGKLKLNESAWLVAQSKFVITHDTGLMHIASAYKKKVYSIWGNTIPSFGMYPYQTDHEIIENNNLSCRPCSKIGYNKCPKGHFKCMNELSFPAFN